MENKKLSEDGNNIERICVVCAAKRRKQWQRDNQNLVISVGDFVKVGVHGKGVNGKDCVEHLWVEISMIDNNKFTGKIDNLPISLADVKYGDEVHFKRKKIEDYWSRPWWESYNDELTIDKQLDDLNDVPKYYNGYGMCNHAGINDYVC